MNDTKNLTCMECNKDYFETVVCIHVKFIFCDVYKILFYHCHFVSKPRLQKKL